MLWGLRMTNWQKLLAPTRRKDKQQKGGEVGDSAVELRTEIERDYDRILFSTPVRRLADKTQVFPLERNDSVRNRLTHSHEVSNLARSIGTTLAFTYKIAQDVDDYQRNVPALLAAIGLAHDLGNPPFGHQGEFAIRSWYKAKSRNASFFEGLDERQKQDFLQFEGNAQTLRLVSRLQPGDNRFGLNLTHATLAALMKYPTSSDDIDDKIVARKKFGIFASEQSIVDDVWAVTGLSKGKRHPLTYVMEACDDIAYTVLDAEDAVKKGLVSFHDLISFLETHGQGDAATESVVQAAKRKHAVYRHQGLSPFELNDVATQRFRVFAIGRMVSDIREAFIENRDQLEVGELPSSLIEVSKSDKLRNLLKDFDKANAYAAQSVREIELIGYKTIQSLMDYLWDAISTWEQGAKREIESPYGQYIYSRVSENYRRVFEEDHDGMDERYRKLQLVGDMVSGMTDSFAINFCEELRKYCAKS